MEDLTALRRMIARDLPLLAIYAEEFSLKEGASALGNFANLRGRFALRHLAHVCQVYRSFGGFHAKVGAFFSKLNGC
ncbi:MAG: hypothetical protein ACTS4T_00920 [Candidatus Hodgkinia cicadicola]